ncbi:MAG: hypothetical protein JWL59_2818 [Chthoniobacteraceae bacterium]|nr:hypothetical protein [Chthoniobacteraceae bacterium]
MENFLLGIKALFRIWGDKLFGDQVKQLLEGHIAPAAPPPVEQKPVEPPPAAPAPVKEAPARSEAVTLLTVLQREARFVDFIKEPINDYTDAQIGAAVRSVHKECGAVLDRLFGIETLKTEAEGAKVEVPSGFDPAQIRLTGSIPEHGPFRGTLNHSGWKASRCEIPQWSGLKESALVIAPCEVELK